MDINNYRIRDPFILPHDGKYYLYSTRYGTAKKGFTVSVSGDLENWSDPVPIFDESPEFWGKYDFWAPEVHFYRGKFYLFASFKADGKCRGTHILVSDTPDGRFVPVSEKPATPDNWECLDGTLYVDKRGAPYIVFCHEWTQIKDGEICALRLSEDLSQAIGEPRVLFKASQPSWAKVGLGNNNFVTDGPFLWRTESGRLLMIWSSLESSDYVEAVAYSDNGDITGNWHHNDRLLFAKDGGHGMLFKSFDGKKYFVFHSPNCEPDERLTLREFEEINDEIVLK